MENYLLYFVSAKRKMVNESSRDVKGAEPVHCNCYSFGVEFFFLCAKGHISLNVR